MVNKIKVGKRKNERAGKNTSYTLLCPKELWKRFHNCVPRKYKSINDKLVEMIRQEVEKNG